MNWEDFINAIGKRESSNNYAAKNQFGYLGRFQFGKLRLCDLGLTDGKRWLFDLTDTKFLENPKLQDAVFDTHVAKHRKRILKKYSEYLGATVHDVELTLSGVIACFHLLGEGGFKKFLASKEQS